MESFHRAGAIPAVMKELIKNKKLHTNIKTVTGKTIKQNLRKKIDVDNNVIKSFKNSLAEKAGFLVMKSNFFSSAIMKTSVISKEFKERYLSNPKHPNVFNGKAVVFEGPEDYHKRLNSKKLKIDENSILIVRGCGPVGYPGSAEVVNMQPPDRLLKKGISHLPTLGDGRQSGTSESPSILHVSPESAIGGDLGIVKSLAHEGARNGITANAICPGYISTDMVMAMPEKAIEATISQIPTGRLGEPEEIARCVLFLASEGSGFINGSTISANGAQFFV